MTDDQMISIYGALLASYLEGAHDAQGVPSAGDRERIDGYLTKAGLPSMLELKRLYERD